MVTVLYFTAIFLKATFGLSMQEILILSLAFQLIAIPSTIFFGWLGDRWSQLGAVNVTLIIWVVVLALMGLADGKHAPLAIAITLGLVLGSTQSLLRSMYSQMVRLTAPESISVSMHWQAVPRQRLGRCCSGWSVR